MRKETLAKALRQAIGTMRNSDGCYEIPLEGNLSLFVGWLDGYDEEDPTCIHAKDDPSWCLNAGIKVNTSDNMKTDYEYINSPFYDSGDVWQTDVSLDENEDCDRLADYFLKEFEAMKRCDIDDDGRIANFKSPEDYCSGLVD